MHAVKKGDERVDTTVSMFPACVCGMKNSIRVLFDSRKGWHYQIIRVTMTVMDHFPLLPAQAAQNERANW